MEISETELEKLVTASRVLGKVDAKYFLVPDPTSKKDVTDYGVGRIQKMAKEALETLPGRETIEEYCVLFEKYCMAEEEMHLRGRYTSLRNTARLE